MNEQRQDNDTRDRIVRLESVVDRIEKNTLFQFSRLEIDLKSVSDEYKKLADAHTLMFVEAVKTGTTLHASLEKLTDGVVKLNTNLARMEARLSELEETKLKTRGMIIGATTVITVMVNVIVWFTGWFK